MNFKKKSLINVIVAFVLTFVLIAGVLSVSASPLTSGFISDESAKTIALEQTGGGQVTACTLTYNQGVAEYAVEVVTTNAIYVIYLDARTGSVQSFTRETVIATSTAPPANTSVGTTQPSTPVYSAPVQQNPAPVQNPVPNYSYQQTVSTVMISAEEARSIALAHIGGIGTVVRHETKRDCYKVCIQENNWHYDIDVFFSGTVKSYKVREITFVGSKAFGWNQSGVIGFDAAARVAFDRVGGGVLIENKLDYKSREGLIYKVNIVVGQTEHKIEMYASSGTIFKYQSIYKP